MPISLHYELVGTGWSECRLTIGDKSVQVTASYLSDALESLCTAALAIANGKEKEYARFDEEPGEYRWLLERQDADNVRIRILQFEGLWSDLPDEAGEVIFDAVCTITELVQAVISALEYLHTTHGQKGYRKMWISHPFPSKLFAKLKLVLAASASQNASNTSLHTALYEALHGRFKEDYLMRLLDTPLLQQEVEALAKQDNISIETAWYEMLTRRARG